MSKVRVELDRKNIRSLLKSNEMMGLMESYANKVKSKAGDGYHVSRYTGKNRVNVSVGTQTKKAIQDNLENNTLLKAVGSARD